jgi:hypothetical protein
MLNKKSALLQAAAEETAKHLQEVMEIVKMMKVGCNPDPPTL